MLFNIDKSLSIRYGLQPESTKVKDNVTLVYMCQNRIGTNQMLVESGQYWPGSGTAAFIRMIARKD